MMSNNTSYRIGLAMIVILLALTVTYAGEVTLPNTFTAGTPAVAGEVNANFAAVKRAVDDNHSRIAELEARLEALETSQVMALDSYLTVDPSGDPRGPLVRLAGVNLQLVNGLGETKTINGLGNLIVGYDEAQTGTTPRQCSDGQYSDQAACESAGEIWGNSFKTGSHYLVLGRLNSYARFGGIVAGEANYSTGNFASVIGGSSNSARGLLSSISGGLFNKASGGRASVSGGGSNTASGAGASVSGGYDNVASGPQASVSGGSHREAADYYNWAAGSLFEEN